MGNAEWMQEIRRLERQEDIAARRETARIAVSLGIVKEEQKYQQPQTESSASVSSK